MTAAPIPSRRLQAAALLAPVVIAQGVTYLLGAGPATAPASTAAPPVLLDPVLAPTRPAAPSPQQQACLDYLATLSTSNEPIASPMAHTNHAPAPAAPAAAATAASPTPSAPAAHRAPDVPDLRLTAILGNRTGGMAAIDGRILRPGDRVAPGWRLERIDAEHNRIVIADDRGRTAAIELPRGGAGI